MRNKKVIFALSLLAVLFINAFFFSAVVLGAAPDTSYTTLAGDTPISPGGKADFQTFLPALFKLGIGIAGALSVIYIIIGGMQYLSTDAVNGKNEGKEKIYNALLGLVLAISAYAILNTINPNLVNLNLNIDVLKQGDAISTDIGTPTGTGTGTDGSVSLDPNSPSTAASLRGCVDCDAIPGGVPAKENTAGGCYPSGQTGPCVINKAVGQKLLTLAKSLDGKLSWQVTEMYPPTRPHLDPCQQIGTPTSGTCVDAALRSPATADNIKTFIKLSDEAGLKAVYEVTSTAARSNLIKSGVPSAQIQVPKKKECTTTNTTNCCPSSKYNDPYDTTCSWITGEHFSLYNK